MTDRTIAWWEEVNEMGVPPVVPLSGGGGGDIPDLLALAIGLAVPLARWLASHTYNRRDRRPAPKPEELGHAVEGA